ncbi:hypothetical protein K438DRAFT_1760396 [Mycena galopus ATCC 62051]|nr:hypothetical protein K438DRAFT_1760396 [Mycena galopus ATCC 62051]
MSVSAITKLPFRTIALANGSGTVSTKSQSKTGTDVAKHGGSRHGNDAVKRNFSDGAHWARALSQKQIKCAQTSLKPTQYRNLRTRSPKIRSQYHSVARKLTRNLTLAGCAAVRATTGDGSVKSGLGRRKILSITVYNKGGRKYLLTWAEGRSLENKLRITCPGVTSFMFPHMTRHVIERRTSPGGSGGLGGRSTRPGSESTDRTQVRTRGAEDGGRRSRANARGRLVDPVNEERDDQRSSGSSGSPEVQVRCPEHGARIPRLGSRKTESGRQDARGREGRERMYYAKAIVSGTSLYSSRPHPGDWAYGGSGGPGRTSRAEEGKGSDVMTVAREPRKRRVPLTAAGKVAFVVQSCAKAFGIKIRTRFMDRRTVGRAVDEEYGEIQLGQEIMNAPGGVEQASKDGWTIWLDAQCMMAIDGRLLTHLLARTIHIDIPDNINKRVDVWSYKRRRARRTNRHVA